ncbi:MAG: hypothetical protein IT378_19195 [Sandaracinaceae bacterium]|nr:hypothetical protein [Sandaracinaceae bacterium]
MDLRALILLASLASSACTSSPAASPAVSEQLLLRIASVPNLVRWHRDVLLTCDQPREHALPCSVLLIQSDESFMPADVGPVLAAERLGGNRLLLLRTGRRLVVRDPDGAEHVLSQSAQDPRATSDGERALFTEITSTGRRLALADTRTLETRVITEDTHASTAFDVPGSDRVVFVSTRTQVASLYVAEPDGTERQLTNVGLTELTPEFVPVPVRQLVWLEEGRRMVFTAHYRGRDRLWQVDLETGEALRLGSGRLPVAVDRSHLIAVDQVGGQPVVVRYPAEV